MVIFVFPTTAFRRRFFVFIALILFIASLSGKPVLATPFIDDIGRNVEIIEAPSRIVSLAPSITEILFAIGLSDEVVGVTQYSDYPVEALSKEKVGSYVKLNLEKIISLKPDLVIATTGGNPREFVERLEKIGLTVFVINPREIKDIFSNIRSIGAITGKDKEGALLADTLEKRVDSIRAKVKSLPKPEVFIQLGASPLYTSGGDTFIDDLITMAGGLNIAGKETIRFPVYSIEEVIKRGPDFILTVLMGAEVNISVLPYWKKWSTIPAVKNDRIYTVDPNIVNRPSPRIADGLEVVAKKLHPEAFKEVGLVER